MDFFLQQIFVAWYQPKKSRVFLKKQEGLFSVNFKKIKGLHSLAQTFPHYHCTTNFMEIHPRPGISSLGLIHILYFKKDPPGLNTAVIWAESAWVQSMA